MHAYEAYQLIGDLERRWNVADLRHFGLPVWPIVRHLLMAQTAEMRKRRYARAVGLASHSIPSMVAAGAGGIADDWSRVRIRHADEELMLLDTPASPIEPGMDVLAFHLIQDYRTAIDGALHDEYLDVFHEALGGTWRFGHVLMSHDSVWANRFRFQPAILTFEERPALVADPPQLTELGGSIRKILDDVKSRHRWMSLTTMDVLRRIVRVDVQSRSFERLLALLAPRAVMLQSFSNVDKHALVIAANRLRIPTIDVQHGFIEVGSAYVPPRGARRDQALLYPSDVFCWGDETAGRLDDVFKGAAFTQRHTVAGFPGDLVRRAAPQAATRFARPSWASRVALFIHQPDLTLHSRDGEIVPRHVLAAMAATRGEVLWLLRLHPRSRHMIEAIAGQLRKLGLDNVDVTWASEAPLPEVIAASDSAVTSWSTLAFEADRAGLDVVIIDSVGLSFFQRHITSGAFRAALDREGLVDAVRGGAAAQKPPIAYFAADAAVRAHAALAGILDAGRLAA